VEDVGDGHGTSRLLASRNAISPASSTVLGVADGSVDEAGLIAFLEANSREVP